ncbi:hypothetical protein HOY82DRAFT_546233 [Tuber indicum]|nr:hypothetical protein HOY82DRAFT_546233 [Tuber indicum]
MIAWCLLIYHLFPPPPLSPFLLLLSLILFFPIPLSGTYFPQSASHSQNSIQISHRQPARVQFFFSFFLTRKKSSRHLANFETESVSSSSLPRRGGNAQNGCYDMVLRYDNGTDVSLFSLSSFLPSFPVNGVWGPTTCIPRLERLYNPWLRLWMMASKFRWLGEKSKRQKNYKKLQKADPGTC